MRAPLYKFLPNILALSHLCSSMRTALDDVRFLARSDHRVTVLTLLADEELTRPAIRDATGIPQATLGRILGDFEERNWATKTGRLYRLSPSGTVLAEKFTDLLATVESMQNVEGVARWLPEGAPNPQHFADATVVVPTPANVLAHIERAEQLLEDATEVRIVTPSVFPDALRNQRLRSIEGDQRQEVVVGGDAIDVVLADPELTAITRELVDSRNVRVYRYDGRIDCVLSLVDGRAVVGVLDENGVPCAHIESTNETVVDWADETFHQYRAGATPITDADFER